MTLFLDKGDGGGLVEVIGAPWDNERKRPVLVEVEPSPFAARAFDAICPRYTHQERRRLARQGRKWPKRVPKYRPYVPSPLDSIEVQYVRYDAHLLAFVVNGVRHDHWLYLPTGQRPTDAQLKEVTRRLRMALEIQLHETWLETMRRERGHHGGGAGE